MRMATVITANGVSVCTSDIRCSTDGARPVSTRSARPMGVTHIAWLTGRDGGAAWLNCANMAANRLPRLCSRFSKSRDRTVMAA
jgi:hypothetical protein